MRFLAHIKTVFRLIGFVFYFLGEIILANVVVAIDILTPRHRMKPAILAIPLKIESDIQIMALNNLITMTPGTLSLDISPDRKTIYVHAMYVDDIEKVKNEIINGLEYRILELSQ